MQLRGKKIGILAIVVVYCLTFLIQSNFLFFQVWAKEKNVPRVNIVAILVDSKLYNRLENNGLKWYASKYVQGMLSDTKALVLPLDLDNIKAYDIYRMMENIYFDGLENVNSSLIGLIMIGNIPLPVVNQNGYIFPTVYPYVDFENQKYIWDSESQYFVPNGNPGGQAEIWHGLINYGDDIDAYSDFFTKINKYKTNPDGFIGDAMWYEDFVAQKQAFLEDNYQYYRNKIMFGEDIGYQRYSPLMKKLFSTESQNNSMEIVSDLSDAMGVSFSGMDNLKSVLSDGSDENHTTKMIQQEIETSMLANYNELFGKSILSLIRENIFAGGRRIKLVRDSNGKATQIVNADNSASKIQLKDTMYLGNENLQGLIENLNLMMEEMVDKKIADNKYDMDIVIPVSYENEGREKFRRFLRRRCISFPTRYDNYYFGLNARNVDSVKDLSIYRGTYRNLENLDGLTYNSLKSSYNPIVGKYDSVNPKLKSIGASFDIFSNQVEGNRGYQMFSVENDLNVYNEEKKNSVVQYRREFKNKVNIKFWSDDCDKNDEDHICEDPFAFGLRWWGGASPFLLDSESVSNGRYQLSGYKATDSWRSVFDMGGFQSLLPGSDEGDNGRGWVDGKGTGPQKAGATFKSYIKYSSPTERVGWEDSNGTKGSSMPFAKYVNNTPDIHGMKFSDMDYWTNEYVSRVDRYLPGGEWQIDRESLGSNIFTLAIKPEKYDNTCNYYPSGLGRTIRRQKYTYKVISSIFKHVSTTEDEINGVDRNRYGEGGVLDSYYVNLKNSYNNVNKNVFDIVEELKSLNSTGANIKGEIDNLSGKMVEIIGLDSDITKLVEKIRLLESDLENATEDDDWIVPKQLELDALNQQLSDKVSMKAGIDTEIGKALSNLSVAIGKDKGTLVDVYSAIISLSADEILSSMELIARDERIDLEKFYNKENNLTRVGFSQEWISEFAGMESNIKKGIGSILDSYSYIFESIDEQKIRWYKMKSVFEKLSKANSDKIETISRNMDNIFNISSLLAVDDSKATDNEDVQDTILTGGTAEIIIKQGQSSCPKNVTSDDDDSDNDEDGSVGILGKFDGECGINKMFEWLIEVDKLGPQIVAAAKGDADFMVWLSKSSINYSNFTGADWINQYVQRTKGLGYDSEGAKKNHSLLAGASEHLSGINLLTPDRPIDSPRYVSMQSIAGNEISFIYPDLFKVEVYTSKGNNKSGYDIHELLSVGDIKNNLIKYLNGKVYEYNRIIDEECKKAEVSNAFSDVHYIVLRDVLKYDGAIPDTSKHGCKAKFTSGEFVEALGGDKMLDVISEMLYYQNLTNTRKLSSESISQDIEFIKDSFNVNDKREQVLYDYLVEGNEKEKNPLFVIPTYQLSGYEVGYVNSNGRDYIIADKEGSLGMSGLTLSSRYNNVTTNSSSSKNTQEDTPEEMQLNNECGIPSSGRLPLFSLGSSVGSPWLEGFVCWIKTTLKKPLTVKLTFDSSLGDALYADSLGDFVKNSDLGQTFSDWSDSWDKFADDWESMVSKDTEKNTDKIITEMQLKADSHNKDVTSSNSALSNLLLNIDRNIRISNSNDLLSETKEFSDLEIKSLVDINNVTVEFIGTGDGCLKLDENDLCNGKYIVENFNPKVNPFIGRIVSADHVAGKMALVIRIGAGGEYIEKIIKFTVSPGSLESMDIVFGDKVAVAGMLTPVEVIGYDKYKNHVSWGIEKYKFTVSTGRFLKDGAYQESFETNDFRNLRFYYQAPLSAGNGSKAIIQISKVNDSKSAFKTGSINILEANPEIKLNLTDLKDNNYYRLGDDEGIYDGNKLNISKLQKIDIVMKGTDGTVVDIDSQVVVNSQNGLVVLGQVQKGEDGNYNFFETHKNYMSNGHATIYYYPTKVAGDDVISIEIPGLDVRKINLTIQPAQLSNVAIIPEKDYLNQGDKMEVELFLTDVWGNLVDGSGNIKLDFDDSKLKFLEYPGAKNSVDVKIDKGYKKLNVEGIGAGLTYIIGGGVYAEINIDKHIFPNSGLNIMYLNYFGNDWGNQWGYFSNNNHYIENLMKKSNKVITTTTQLVSEDKIKKMIWKIQPGFKILNLDKINTSLLMLDGKLSISVGGIASMETYIPNSIIWETGTQDSIQDILLNPSNKLKNYMFFIPNDSKYSLGKSGEIFEDGEEIGSILSGDVSLQLTDYMLDSGDNIRNVLVRGVNYGSLVIHFPNMQPSISNFSLFGDRYLLGKTFSNGSTDNLSSVGIFDGASNFDLESSYASIQNSNDISERVGFLGDFKNITLFAEGEIVGEATKNFGSEFVINLGDPLLSRKSLNENVVGTRFDGGIGDLIYADSEKDIYSTYQIDFNNDENEDLLVVYSDGTLKLAKNYGSTPDLRNMQELMRIAVGIEDVFVGDLDGNKYDDILIHTENNQFRAYLNDGGVFDVDGRVVCLNQNVFDGEVSLSPSNLDGIFQLFIEDMDVDGVLDIITYDNMGYIKVFYGGSTDAGLNYLSTDQYSCDSGWYSRQEKNTTKVAALGVQILGDDVFDNSLLHWKGMSKPDMSINESELSEYGVNFDVNKLSELIKVGTDGGDGNIADLIEKIMGNIDVNKASEKYLEDVVKFVDVTLYENKLEGGGEGNNYLFAPSSFLDPNNPEDRGRVRKNYRIKGSGSKILQDGDIVTVRVTIKASNKFSFEGAYGDIIQGPRNLYFDDKGIFKGIVFETNPGDTIVKRRDGNFAYIIDNIKLAPGEEMIFEYDLEYHSLPLRKMSITYNTFWSDDNIPDIKLQSIDGCEKNFDAYINGGGDRSFSYEKILLQDKINEEYLKEDGMTQDYGLDLMEMGGDVSKLPGLIGDRISRISLLGGGTLNVTNDESGKKTLKNAILKRIQEGGLEALNIDLDINLSIFEEQTDAIEGVIDDITKGMCNGFSFGGSSNCKGLPVPFNQAFLAPGQYHLFGCWQLPMGPLENGVPAFFFPGNLGPIPFVGYLPIPYMPTGPMDNFLWVKSPGGPWSSFIRIYAAPTLTAQLGIAICAGPYSVGKAVPSPFADLGGNCVVFAVKPQCNGSDGLGGDMSDLDNPNETYVDYIEDVRDSGVCSQSQKGPMVTKKGKRSSPFGLYSYTHNNVDVNGGSYRVDVNGGSYNVVEYETSSMGIINLEVDSFIGSANSSSASFMIGDVDVLGGDFNINKIRGGIQQGVRKLLIDKWLDPQIRYILNQLTKMHINIILPDMSNLGKNELQVLGNLVNNFGDFVNLGENGSSNGDNDEGGNVSSWESFSRKNMEDFNKQIANPFEALSSLMNESNIINISTETLTLKIPMIFPEDINAYEIYLHQWLDINTQIVNDWRSLLETFVANCDKKETEHERNVCKKNAQENLNSFIEFQEKGDWQKMQNQIYSNIVILQEYRNFPFEIYEWVHVIDRYISELMSLVNNTIGYLAYWTNTNSQRFVGYVDAIVLILNIIKTYQLLIDFSVEWGQNCGNCARDTYDQYSCKLSMLCDMIDLPIIQIPNFKLPNVTIDLSNIDVSLDIVLPKFNFQPVSISLPQLPNLPEPPSISVNIKLFDLPNIPLLPEPPELPELPSFIPEVELELPVLPPAPEVPKLPNSIESIIEIAKLIGKIYCIVKGQFGMVGESSVKAKIEQLTQRTYDVPWIDNIMDFTNLSIAPIHNYGVDYEIDSYLDLQFNFSTFYDYLDTLTKSINSLTTMSVNQLNGGIDSLIYDNYDNTLGGVDSIGFEANISMADLGNINGDVEGMMSDEVEYVEYSKGKSRLKDVLAFFRKEVNNTSFSDNIGQSINRIENQIDRENSITSNTDGLNRVKMDVIDYLNNEKVNYEGLLNLINEDYEGFLAMVDSKDFAVDDVDNKLLTFNVNLFNVDSLTQDTINSTMKDNPYEILLKNKQSIVDGYRNALNQNTAKDLGLTDSQYLVLRDNVSSMKNQSDMLYTLTKQYSPTNLVAKNGGGEKRKSLYAGLRLGSQMEVASVIDPSALSKGIYEKIQEGASKGKFTKVIYSDSFAESIGDSYYDTSHTDKHDIVLWTNNSIYKKCYNQDCFKYNVGSEENYYHFDTIDKIPYKERWIVFDSDTKLKISDEVEEIKNWRVAGQNYDELSFSWNNAYVDGYLIKLVDRIDYSYEKSDYKPSNRLRNPKYVLALPDNMRLDGSYQENLKLELFDNKIYTVVEALSGKDIVEVVYYNPNKSRINVGISEIDRKWYYSRIASLNLSGDTYSIDSPWSNQVVAGRQILGDDLPPMGDAVLIRHFNKKIASEGDNLDGYVGTKYTLRVNWNDNVDLSYLAIYKDGKLLSEKNTSEATDFVDFDINIHTDPGKEIYTSVGIDQFGNMTEKMITVEYFIPDITITDISKNSDGESLSIIAELSQDIDQGSVSFQRKRGNSWDTMKPIDLEDENFQLVPEQTVISGSSFSFGNEIALYDKKGDIIAVLDPDTAEIKMQNENNDLFGVKVVVQDGMVIQIYNKDTQNSVFSLSVPAEECLKIEADNYTLSDISKIGNMGMYSGGKVVHREGRNELFLSPTCHLYSEYGMEGTYSYDRGMGAIQLVLYPNSDVNKINPIKIWLKVKPLVSD